MRSKFLTGIRQFNIDIYSFQDYGLSIANGNRLS